MSATPVLLIAFCAVLLPSKIQSKQVIVDLSHTLNSGSIRYPAYRKFELTVISNGTSDITGGWLSSNDVAFFEHTSTHLDAPAHFASRPGIYYSSTIPVERLIGLVSLINLAAKAAENRDYLVTAEDITEWEATYGRIPAGAIVLFDFNWVQYRDSYNDVFGLINNDTTSFHFPGVGIDAAKILGERGVYGVGIDTPSLDYGPSRDFPTHYHLLEQNIYFLENVGDMSALPAGGEGVTLVVGAMKIEGGSGGPARLIATFDSSPVSLGLRLSGCTVLLFASLCVAAIALS